MKARGFTLIELMVVVAIVAIIAAIAVPSFNESVRKSRRSEAITTLADLQLRQERWRSNNTTYGTLAQVSNTTDALFNAAQAHYSFTVTNNNNVGYTLTASPKSGSAQQNDRCGDYTFTMASGTVTKAAAGGGNCL